MNRARIAAGAISFLVAIVFAISSTATQWRMVDEVNTRLPQDAQFGRFWWYPLKTVRLIRHYHCLVPTGRRMRQLRRQGVGVTIAFTLVVLAAAPGAAGLVAALFLGIGGLACNWLTFRVAMRPQ